ncbi:MAG TPA: 5-(carboxyamino)imidazole ribonucleotide synthase [Nitrospiraceae bacterium]|nr:5-(carboxyamino)imidazole ribonucleotide synthase [Nitrospiraceae bacterium]
MTEKILEPGSILGVLGGGQLGAMFAGAARRMGYQVAVWDPDADAPTHQLASHSFTAPFSDTATREKFVRTVHAVTFEWENVPALLCEWLEQHHRVRPSGALLRIIQDRIEQKQFLQSRRLPVPAFTAIESPDQLAEAVKKIGIPAICKTATTGYDGKGQWTLRQNSDVASIEQILRSAARPSLRWVLESVVNFERELSVLVVRGEGGERRSYPAVENRHEQGILRMTLAPAPIAPDMASKAADLAGQAVAALNGVGVFCVELFQTAVGDLLINEIAPRPHNSGHYTLDACSVSQFEQQVRAVCSMPLGETRLLSPAAMVNLIGEEVRSVTSGRGVTDLLSIPGAVLHLYGKRVIRPGRKMGHVTFLADRGETAADRANQFMRRLA